MKAKLFLKVDGEDNWREVEFDVSRIKTFPHSVKSEGPDMVLVSVFDGQHELRLVGKVTKGDVASVQRDVPETILLAPVSPVSFKIDEHLCPDCGHDKENHSFCGCVELILGPGKLQSNFEPSKHFCECERKTF